MDLENTDSTNKSHNLLLLGSFYILSSTEVTLCVSSALLGKLYLYNNTELVLVLGKFPNIIETSFYRHYSGTINTLTLTRPCNIIKYREKRVVVLDLVAVVLDLTSSVTSAPLTTRTQSREAERKEKEAKSNL